MSSAAGDVEVTHCVVGKVFAFSVPPLSSSDGYKATLWSKTPIWTGRLRVVSRGDRATILLEHSDKDGLYASCPVTDNKTVESCVDSSRYFVLRLSDGKGHHALMGIGFNDRAQAFDFKVSLQEFENHNRAVEALQATPAKDYSIPQGGTIHVNLSEADKEKKKKKKKEKELEEGLGDLKLAPPPGKGEKEEEKKKKKKKDKEKEKESESSAPAVVGGQADILGFGGFGFSTPSTSASSAAAPAADPFDPFSSPAPTNANAKTPFDDPFGSTDFETPSDWVKF